MPTFIVMLPQISSRFVAIFSSTVYFPKCFHSFYLFCVVFVAICLFWIIKGCWSVINPYWWPLALHLNFRFICVLMCSCSALNIKATVMTAVSKRNWRVFHCPVSRWVDPRRTWAFPWDSHALWGWRQMGLVCILYSPSCWLPVLLILPGYCCGTRSGVW